MFKQKKGNCECLYKYEYIARKDETGAVIIEPRNFTTKPGKKGNIDAVLFDKKPSYIAIGKLKSLSLIIILIYLK